MPPRQPRTSIPSDLSSPRELRYLREEGLFPCAICQAPVLHAPSGDVSPVFGDAHRCGEHDDREADTDA